MKEVWDDDSLVCNCLVSNALALIEVALDVPLGADEVIEGTVAERALICVCAALCHTPHPMRARFAIHLVRA